MKKIPLTRGQYAIVDDIDYGKLMKYKWQCAKSAGYCYASRAKWNGKYCSSVQMHRQILNAPKNKYVDHINGNGLDNRRKNLRIATNSQNLMNSKIFNTNTSGYRGVGWDKKEKKWKARITQNQKHKFLGYYLTKEDAAKAYNHAAKKLFGSFAKVNIIKPHPAMKLFTAEEAYELAVKAVHDELKNLQQIEFNKAIEFTLKGIKLPLQEALKQAFGIKGKEINT